MIPARGPTPIALAAVAALALTVAPTSVRAQKLPDADTAVLCAAAASWLSERAATAGETAKAARFDADYKRLLRLGASILEKPGVPRETTNAETLAMLKAKYAQLVSNPFELPAAQRRCAAERLMAMEGGTIVTAPPPTSQRPAPQSGMPPELAQFLSGPWGKTTNNWEPQQSPLLPGERRPGGPATTRSTCPPGGLASPRDMIDIEQWFERRADGQFGRVSSKGVWSELKYEGMPSPTTVVFSYSAGGTPARMTVTRVDSNRIKIALSVSGMVVPDTPYARCRKTTAAQAPSAPTAAPVVPQTAATTWRGVAAPATLRGKLTPVAGSRTGALSYLDELGWYRFVLDNGGTVENAAGTTRLFKFVSGGQQMACSTARVPDNKLKQFSFAQLQGEFDDLFEALEPAVTGPGKTILTREAVTLGSDPATPSRPIKVAAWDIREADGRIATYAMPAISNGLMVVVCMGTTPSHHREIIERYFRLAEGAFAN